MKTREFGPAGFLALVALLAAVALTQPRPAHTQIHTDQQPYAGQQERTIKALSADEIDGLRNAHGMGLAKAVELNHYPGPKHVLQLAEQLSLSPEQIERTQALFEEMRELAVDVGERIIDAEAELDKRCRSGKISESELSERLAELGDLQGQLRFAHMRAHLRQKKLFTAEQITTYDQLRGYTD